MRQNGEKTDEKRMALLQEYLSSGMSRTAFEKEKGLGHCTISRWFRIFAVEDKPIACSQQAAVTDTAARRYFQQCSKQKRLRKLNNVENPEISRYHLPSIFTVIIS